MIHRKRLLSVLALFLGLLGGGSCTEVGLYQWKHDPYQANKLTVSGMVCSDDPHQRNFPVKILFIIDVSSSLASDLNDNHGWRGKAIDDVVNLYGKSPNYHFGIIAYGAKARNLVDTGFTKDSSLLAAAAAAVKGSGGITAPGGCLAGRCRDLKAAVSLASSVVTGDILAGDPGEIARTTYVLVLFSGGPPVPAIGRCNCREQDSEGEPENWQACPWTECDGCKVTCPVNATCEDTLCYPICEPTCDQGREYCDSDYVCKIKPDDGTPNPTVPAISSQGTTVPDTFTQWVPPAQPGISLPPGASSCNLSCVFDAASGEGHADSCEEKTLVAQIRELKDYAKKNGAAQLQLHTTYLPDLETRQDTDPFFPPCSPEADRARSVRLLNEMAFAGDGGFTQFGNATAISFKLLDLHTSRDPLVIKEFMVTNTNVIADERGSHIDTDYDGIPDEKEALVKSADGTKVLCPADEDTDGDGLGDGVEIRLALDPLEPNDPIECIDLLTSNQIGPDPCSPSGDEKSWRLYKSLSRDGKEYFDRDGDGLNPCEERLLGTQDSLFDTDADGIPDKVEFVAGTNYLAVDPLLDSDFDGIINREEIRGHTDPRANDSQTQLDLAYRYEEVDEGVKEVLSYTQPPNVTGVTIKNVSAGSSAGIGWLKFSPGPPPTLAWRDPADMGPGGNFGPEVEISRPAKDGYRLTSCAAQAGSDCTPESQERFITVLVDGPDSYPPDGTTDTIVVSSAMRNCLRFRVRNITLMETGLHRVLGSTGNNLVDVIFAQAPKNAKDGYGIFRKHSIRLNYHLGPPEERTPRTAELTLSDDDFVLFE